MLSSHLSKKDIHDYINSFLLFIIVIMAFWLRYRNLGALGLYGDEDFTYLAVKGTLERGYPVMPSGMIYPRGIIFTYLAFVSASLFGLSEFSIRLPGVIMSISIIIILYILVKDIFGCRVAILTSLLYSLSAWDIEMSRHARMYETFLFFFLLSSLSFYKGFIRGHRIFRFLTPLLFILTTMVHLLGIFLMVFFVCPFLMKDYKVVSKRSLFTFIGITASIDILYKKFVDYQYNLRLSPLLLSSGESPAKEGGVVPDFSLISHLFSQWQWTNITFLLIIILLCFSFLTKLGFIYKNKGESNLDLLISGTIALTVFVQQYGLSLWIFTYSLYRRHKGVMGLNTTLLKTNALFLIASFAVWLAWGFYDGIRRFPGINEIIIVKKVFLSLLDYPFITLRWFYDVMPLMTIIVIFACLTLLERISRKYSNTDGILMLVGFIGPLVSIGFLKKWPADRFLYMAYPFFLTMFVWFIVEINEYVISRIVKSERLGRIRGMVVLICTVISVFVFSNDHSYVQAKMISDRAYSSFVENIEIFEYKKHPDHKNASLYIKKNMKNRDVIIAIDSLMAFIYVGKVDYLLRTEGISKRGRKLSHDFVVGTPVIDDLIKLKKIITNRGENNVWLVTSHELMGPHLNESIMSREVMMFIEKSKDQVVYTAEDGVTQVFLWKS